MVKAITVRGSHIAKLIEFVAPELELFASEVSTDDGVLAVTPKDTDKDLSKCRYTLAESITFHVIDYYEGKLVERVIRQEYSYFSTTEKKEIYGIVMSILNNESHDFMNSLLHIRRQNLISREATNLLKEQEDFDIDGFVNFRLKEYIKDLEEVVDKAVDDFLMDREYKEFIRLLRYFVDIQDPQIDFIQVEPKPDGTYKLTGPGGKDITDKLAEYSEGIDPANINHDDLLVSALIALAPKKVFLKGQFFNRELADTIMNVFGDRAEKGE